MTHLIGPLLDLLRLAGASHHHQGVGDAAHDLGDIGKAGIGGALGGHVQRPGHLTQLFLQAHGHGTHHRAAATGHERDLLLKRLVGEAATQVIHLLDLADDIVIFR